MKFTKKYFKVDYCDTPNKRKIEKIVIEDQFKITELRMKKVTNMKVEQLREKEVTFNEGDIIFINEGMEKVLKGHYKVLNAPKTDNDSLIVYKLLKDKLEPKAIKKVSISLRDIIFNRNILDNLRNI